MSAKLSQEQILVLYEMSLSISPQSNVEQTLEAAVSTYLQKLNCSAAAVLTPVGSPDDEDGRSIAASLPGRHQTEEAVEDVCEQLPDAEHRVESMLPLVDEVEPGLHRYVLSLPDFGVLLLLKRGTPLRDDIVLSLPDLNEKLATACNRVAIQQQYEAQYRTLFQEAPVMFTLTREEDGNPIIEDCNERFAEKLGYTVDQLRGRSLAEFYTEESRQKLRSGGFEDALGGQFGTQERELRSKNGKELVTTLRATPRYDERGAVIGTRVLFIDVTELKRQKVQISVLNRALRHNIRNNLSVIQGKLDTVIDDQRGPEKQVLEDVYGKSEELLSIAENARQVQRLIDETTVQQHDLDEVIETVAARAQTQYPDATIEVRTSFGAVSVLGTSTLEHALWELVENACVHAGDSPMVSVDVRRSEGTATVTVADDGPGVPEAEYEVIGAGEESTLEHGSGLGLWLVQWVVDMSGGELAFRGGGDGAVVEVTLPLAEETP
ncbi:PAS domain S-box protein [Halobellus sp. Atlit-31R]|nr:PAS domain S-box protein [Halobellus sp. Atlit-31R]